MQRPLMHPRRSSTHGAGKGIADGDDGAMAAGRGKSTTPSGSLLLGTKEQQRFSRQIGGSSVVPCIVLRR